MSKPKSQPFLITARTALAVVLCGSLSCAEPSATPDEELERDTSQPEGSEQELAQSVRLMVVGDSISQGLEGDFTWRYRLWEHLTSKGVQAQFVGPWTGTTKTGPWTGTGAPPSHAGAYRPGISASFPKTNLAEWGWMMGEAKWLIADQVRTYTPDVLLIELGFNDIAWNLSDTPPAEVARGVLESLEQLVTNARLVKPDIKVLVTDAPQRTPIEGYPQLPGKITAYNQGIDATIANLHKTTSPVHRVYFDLLYNQVTDTYDGLHPNVRGEYVIAEAFADELWKKFGIGGLMDLPSSMPADLKPGATGAMTIRVNGDFTADMSWPHVFGAGGFWIWTRDVTRGETGFQKLLFPIGADGWRPSTLPAGHHIEYKLQTMRGDYSSPFSPVATLVAPALAEVKILSAVPGVLSATLSWTTVPNADDYHVYAGSGCSDSVPGTGGYQLVQYSLGNKTSWTHEYITNSCMNYYVVASRNGGEGPRPPIGIRVWPYPPIDCSVDSTRIPSSMTAARNFANSIRNSCVADYERVLQRLVRNRYSPVNTVQIIFVDRPFGQPHPAATDRTQIQVNYNHAQQHPTDRGMILHEMAHVVQAYPTYLPPWSEGIADWVRYDLGEPPDGHSGSAANCQGGDHYSDGYECTAAFLEYMQDTYNTPVVPDMNALLHAGRDEWAARGLLESVGGKTVTALWRDCLNSTCAGGRVEK